MANLLIVYGTTEGQTRKIAQWTGGIVRFLGHDAEVVDSSAVREDLDLSHFDALFVMGSLHQGSHQRSLVQFVKDHVDELEKVPTAFFSVSLTAAYTEGDHQHELNQCANAFFDQTGWEPTVWTPVAGALKYLEYDWIRRMVLKSIAGKAGGSTDTSQDHEYTDWVKLEAFICEFMSSHVKQVAAPN